MRDKRYNEGRIIRLERQREELQFRQECNLFSAEKVNIIDTPDIDLAEVYRSRWGNTLQLKDGVQAQLYLQQENRSFINKLTKNGNSDLITVYQDIKEKLSPKLIKTEGRTVT